MSLSIETPALVEPGMTTDHRTRNRQWLDIDLRGAGPPTWKNFADCTVLNATGRIHHTAADLPFTLILGPQFAGYLWRALSQDPAVCERGRRSALLPALGACAEPGFALTGRRPLTIDLLGACRATSRTFADGTLLTARGRLLHSPAEDLLFTLLLGPEFVRHVRQALGPAHRAAERRSQ
jgi:hypothetical protein